MIVVTRLDDKQTMVNPDLIVSVEDTPDTVITFVNGQRVVVKETPGEILDRAIAYKRRVFSGLSLVPARPR